MNLKTGLIITLFILHLSVFAQERKGKGGGENIADFKDELGLSDEQLEKIKAINTEYFPKIREARKAEPQDKEVLKKFVKERKSKIEAILTPEQASKWREILEKKRTGRKNPELKRAIHDYRQKNIKPVMLEKRIRLEVQLSAEEKESIAEVRAKIHAFKKGMKKAHSESADKSELRQRGAEVKKEALNTLKPIADRHKKTIEIILSEIGPLQKTWMEDMDSIRSSFGIKPKTATKKAKSFDKQKEKMILKFLLIEPEG